MNFWDAISFRHSSCKTSHRVTKRSKAITFQSRVSLFISPILKTYLPKVCWVAQHVHIKKLCHISAAVCVIFLSERWADSSTLFLDHLTLLCLGPCCPDSPDQLPQSDRSWHSLENIKKKTTNKHDDHLLSTDWHETRTHQNRSKAFAVHLLRSVHLNLNK